MSSLKIAVGFAEPGNRAKPFPIYVGYSGAEMESALKASAAGRFEIFPCAYGIRKNNPRAPLNAERLRAVEAEETAAHAQRETAPSTEISDLCEKIATLERNLELAESAYTAATVKIEAAEQQAAALSEQLVAVEREAAALREQCAAATVAVQPVPTAPQPAAAPETSPAKPAKKKPGA